MKLSDHKNLINGAFRVITCLLCMYIFYSLCMIVFLSLIAPVEQEQPQPQPMLDNTNIPLIYIDHPQEQRSTSEILIEGLRVVEEKRECE